MTVVGRLLAASDASDVIGWLLHVAMIHMGMGDRPRNRASWFPRVASRTGDKCSAAPERR